MLRDSKLRDAHGACIVGEVIDGTKDCLWGMIFITNLSICTTYLAILTHTGGYISFRNMLFINLMWIACLCVYLCGRMWMQMPTEPRRWHWIFLELELQQLWAAQCGCWHLNSGPFQEQCVHLTAEHSLQPQGNRLPSEITTSLQLFSRRWKWKYLVESIWNMTRAVGWPGIVIKVCSWPQSDGSGDSGGSGSLLGS